MTSPNIGSAEVNINANVDEEKLARGARKAGEKGGDDAASGFSKKFRDRLKGFNPSDSFRRALGRGSKAQRDLDRSADESSRRFTQRFREGFNRLDDKLYDRLVALPGQLRRLDNRAIESARRFTDSFRRGFGRLDDDLYSRLVNLPGQLRRLDVRAEAAARRFVTSFREGFRRLDDNLYERLVGLPAQLRRLDVNAEAGARRFVTRFKDGFRRLDDDLYERLLDAPGALRRLDARAVEASRRFSERFRAGFRRLDDNLYSRLINLPGQLRRLDTAAFSAARRFRDGFARLDDQLFAGLAAAARPGNIIDRAAGRGALTLLDGFRRGSRGLDRAVFGRLADGARAAGRNTARLYNSEFLLRLRGFPARPPPPPRDPNADPDSPDPDRPDRPDRSGFRRRIAQLRLLLRGLTFTAKATGQALNLLLTPLRLLGKLGRIPTIILALSGALLATVRPLGQVYNGLLEILGVVVGLPAAVVAAGLAFIVFKAGAKGLSDAVEPVRQAFKGLDVDINNVFRKLTPTFAQFARTQAPEIRKGLVGLADDFREFIRDSVVIFGQLKGGAQIEGFSRDVGSFFDELRRGGGLKAGLDLLLQLIVQVGNTFGRLGDRFGEFLKRLRARNVSTDFASIFERAVNGIVNLVTAIIAAGGALSDFFKAASGGGPGQPGRTDQPFLGLRTFFDDLRLKIVLSQGKIFTFFERVEAVLRGVGAAGRFLKEIFQPTLDFFRSPEFAEGIRAIREEFGGNLAAGQKESTTQGLGALILALAKTLVANGPAIINFFGNLAAATGELAGALALLEPAFFVISALVLSLNPLFLTFAALEKLRLFLDKIEQGEGPEAIYKLIRALTPLVVALALFLDTPSTERLRLFFAEVLLLVQSFFREIGLAFVLNAPSFIVDIAAFFADLIASAREFLQNFPGISLAAVQAFVANFAIGSDLGGGLIAALGVFITQIEGLLERLRKATEGLGDKLLDTFVPFHASLDDDKPKRIIRRRTAFAHGGYVDRPTNALIGEAGPELILPLSRPQRTQDLLANAGLTAGSSSVTRYEFTGAIHGLTIGQVQREAQRRARLAELRGAVA